MREEMHEYGRREWHAGGCIDFLKEENESMNGR